MKTKAQKLHSIEIMFFTYRDLTSYEIEQLTASIVPQIEENDYHANVLHIGYGKMEVGE